MGNVTALKCFCYEALLNYLNNLYPSKVTTPSQEIVKLKNPQKCDAIYNLSYFSAFVWMKEVICYWGAGSWVLLPSDRTKLTVLPASSALCFRVQPREWYFISFQKKRGEKKPENHISKFVKLFLCLCDGIGIGGKERMKTEQKWSEDREWTNIGGIYVADV